jgi:hypothetical protein
MQEWKSNMWTFNFDNLNILEMIKGKHHFVSIHKALKDPSSMSGIYF